MHVHKIEQPYFNSQHAALLKLPPAMQAHFRYVSRGHASGYVTVETTMMHSAPRLAAHGMPQHLARHAARLQPLHSVAPTDVQTQRSGADQPLGMLVHFCILMTGYLQSVHSGRQLQNCVLRCR